MKKGVGWENEHQALEEVGKQKDIGSEDMGLFFTQLVFISFLALLSIFQICITKSLIFLLGRSILWLTF